jgi:hypothetical protein
LAFRQAHKCTLSPQFNGLLTILQLQCLSFLYHCRETKSQIVIYKWILFAYLEFIRSLWKKLDAAESGRNFLCLSKSKSVWPFYLAQQLLHLCVALSVCRSGLPDLKLVQFTKLEKKSNDHTKYQIFVSPCLCVDQGCQILLGSIYQIGEKNQMTAQYT